RSEVGGLTRLKLYAGGDIGDGQAQALEGQLVFAGDDPPVLHALAKGWVETRAFGPFGELLPQIMPTEQEYSDWVQKQVKQKLDPWAEPIHGCVSDPGATGNQPDFGTVVMRPDLLLGDPRRLPAIRRSIYQEACRPTHFREQDKAPVTLPNHPNLITHRGRPHWRAGNWIDTLGKPRAYLTRTAHAPSNRVWSGHDNEHWSVNYLCAYALTTGDRWAIAECHHKTELWLSQFTTKTGTYNDNPGPARAVGRGLLAGCWLYLVTGREEIRARILTRYSDLRPHMAKPRAKEVKLRVLAPRWAKDRGHYWPPWEEGMAVTSLMAVHHLFGVTDAKTLAIELSDLITMHAFGRVNGSWRIGYKIPFQHGNGKVYIPDNDPEWATKYAAGGGLTTWGLAAVVVAAEHSGRTDVRARAAEILKQQLADMSGTSDRLQWVCVSGSAVAYVGQQ
ncbi:MAG: hypothetical protein V3U11_00515, partial [Planctomycetota bacterium]